MKPTRENGGGVSNRKCRNTAVLFTKGKSLLELNH
jgi:hypothetical protein